MRFLPWWQDRRNAGSAGNRLARFRKILEAALTLPIYEASLRSSGIDGKSALNRITNIESVLAQWGVVALNQVHVRPLPGGSANAVVNSPLPIAAIPDLRWNSDGCVVLHEGSGLHWLPRALLIRTGFEDGLLSAIDRDGLWQRHGVPMFEHLVGMDGALLAWECETHSGLHIVEENVVFEYVQGALLLTSLTDVVQPTIQLRTGWAAKIETETCDCGRAGRRLVGLRELAPRSRVNRLAVAAHS